MHTIFWAGGVADGNLMWEFSRYIGPYKISHWIKKNGYSSQVIDFITNFSEEELYTVTKKFITSETVVIGISTTFISQRAYNNDGVIRRIPTSVYKTAHRLKKEFPKIKFVLGGYMSEKLPGMEFVDTTVMSYDSATEDIFLEYVKHLVHGDPAPLGELVMPAYGKNNKHRMWYNKARTPRYNIEHDDFRFTEQDAILHGEALPLDVSRGCIFACKFCQYPHLGKGKLDYIRGMEYIEQELIHNYEKFNTTNYHILDETFNDTEFKMRAFRDMTARLPFKIQYSTYLRADLIHRYPDMAYLLKDSGVFGVFHGIESFHPQASKLVGKAWSGKHGKEFLPKLYHDIWKGQVPMHLSFIVGLPGESSKDIDDTISWHISNNMHCSTFFSLTLWGTELSRKNSRHTIQSEFDKNPEKYGFTFENDQWKNDLWTWQTAIKKSNEANAQLSKHNGLGAFAIPTYKMLGFTDQDIMKKVIYPVDVVKQRFSDRIQSYKNKIMSL